MLTVQQRCFLVVDDEPLVTRCLARVLRRFGPTVTASSATQACELLRARADWLGLLIDLHLTDGSGLDVLEFARSQQTHASAVILSGAMEPDAINGAYALDAKCLCKPWRSEHIRQFAQEALASEQEVPTKITKAVSALATKHALTPAQTEILMSAVRGIDRASIVAARRVSENTHKTQVRGILRKTRTLSLGELRDRVLRSVAGAA